MGGCCTMEKKMSFPLQRVMLRAVDSPLSGRVDAVKLNSQCRKFKPHQDFVYD